ncbi:ABC transporter substrate-binding protein [Brachybacterium sp. AOP42-C2-15]|uniref:ABC transporter substrate-binding protein n=1 Tax=unclassified Brachybacterium TaxID=2623841 RepID=UPI003F90573B
MSATTFHIPRRPVLAGVALAGASFALGGCALEPEEGGRSGGIRAAWWGGDSENGAVNAALDAFTEETGTEIAREPQAWDGYWDRLATQTAGGNAPDFIMQAGSQIPDYAGRGTLTDLNSLESLDAEAVDEGLKEFGQVEDALYGVVAASNAMSLVVNQGLAGEAGLEVPDGEYAWEELAEMATKSSESLGDDVWGLQDGGGDLILFILKVRDDGRQFYADDGTLNATADDLTKWLEYWEELRQNGGVPPADVTAEAQGEMASNPMATGRAAMSFGWTQDFISYTRLVDSPLTLHIPPYVQASPSLWMNAASLWSLSSTSADAEKAAEIVNFMINSDTAISALGVSLGMPPSQGARDQLAGTLSDPEQMAMDFMDKVAETSTPLNRLWPAGFAELRSLLGDLNEAVAFGETPIAEAVEQFFTTADSFE